MFQALDLTTPRPDAPSSTTTASAPRPSNTWPSIGGAFGWGLKRNVIDLYKFVCRNYATTTTEIYGFGFSRGAFTIRVLMGLITMEGLVSVHVGRGACTSARSTPTVHFRRKCFKPPLFSPVHAYRLVRACPGQRIQALRRDWRTTGANSGARCRASNSWACGTRFPPTACRSPNSSRPSTGWFWPTELQRPDRSRRKSSAHATHCRSTTNEPPSIRSLWDETTETTTGDPTSPRSGSPACMPTLAAAIPKISCRSSRSTG